MADLDRQRVGLVLGAGGVLGGAELTGAPHAIATETGGDPRSSEHIVGTSPGAMIGALLACGVPPWHTVAHSAGEDIEQRSPLRDHTPTHGNVLVANVTKLWKAGSQGRGSFSK
jgi:predicted acylesterase/phospholipase RssA